MESIMSDKEYLEFYEQRYKALPEHIKQKALSFLRDDLDDDFKEQVRLFYGKDKVHWMSPYHFFTGMSIRNSLRDNVCLDTELSENPEFQNWDDYYVKLLEVACKCYENENV